MGSVFAFSYAGTGAGRPVKPDVRGPVFAFGFAAASRCQMSEDRKRDGFKIQGSKFKIHRKEFC